jgi:hypothetical protein
MLDKVKTHSVSNILLYLATREVADVSAVEPAKPKY